LVYAVRLLLSMQAAQLVGVPPNKNVIELKMPKQEVRERYLPLKAGRLTSADAAPQEEPSHIGDF
jgi:propanediol dehydratase large subunit